MPNKSRSAGHVPFRTCIICRKKTEQRSLLGFFILGNEVIFDVNRMVNNRKKYVCHQVECLNHLDKWMSKYLKKTGSSQRRTKQM